ncbi:Thiol:disulfide interchange protein DsbD precursor [Brevundimonas diminuta]|uniref:protein-disulfide reductase DsbD n=1 Tax=Brevundimonas diminuta TaxID=293 RepID=UPI000207ECAB|nr:protein-disulfide reductase DsbD [Brevundimonas diminuta]EGF94447.1 cytochrome C biogenesis protein transmembrane region family protein [Brevundimonas diminuta ATCC 11568]OWR20580.1 cytochrome C biogenesis protein [Brevundimonas diminuta]WQE46791.1 protein-disulfide reductase DsbD [Brevundimonas diminuta]SPU47737.1 Thiol:disulfide interchange protein DsbD precursor [Brevundimonas diminuta]SUW16048.1 Thiol:disulfide interchange protein DsbD precursor [Brevundimonas diminuta]
MKIIFSRLLATLAVLMLSAPAPSLAQGLGQSFGQPLLSPEEAFTLQISREVDGDLIFAWKIAPGHYLYKDHTAATAPDGKTALPLRLRAGEKKDDPGFGVVDIWRDAGRAVLSADALKRANDPASINITYQGCLENSICYPPTTRTVDVPALPSARIASREAEAATAQAAAVLALQKTPATQTTDAAESAEAEPVLIDSSEPDVVLSAAAIQLQQDQGFVDRLSRQGGTVWVLLAFFGFGVLLAFTPCVFPMYPILAGVIGRGVDGQGTRRGLLLSVAYVLGLAVAFGLLGVAAAWSGQNLQMVLQSPWAVGGLAVVFTVLAVSMFGAFELQLPSAWTSRLSRDTGTGRRSVVSASGLGFLSALIAGPCVTAPLAGALLYIAQTGDVLLGAAALFFLGLGKGVPLIVFGAAGARFLPKAGAWMNRVKIVFGFIFLGMAWWLASRILPPVATLSLGAALCFAAAAALGLFRPAASGVLNSVARAAGLIAAVWGVLLLIGVSLDAVSPWRPLAPLARSALAADSASSLTAVPAVVVADNAALETAVAQAAAKSRPALVYFTAEWCVSCRVMEREVFQNDEVLAELGAVDLIKVDVTQSTPEVRDLLDRYGVVGPPTMIFLSRTSKEAAESRLIGEASARAVLTSLERAGAAE